MKQPKSESSREQLRKIKEASAKSGISHDPDFARRRASEGQAVDTLSDVVKGTKQNIAARPILEKAEGMARQSAFAPKPVGKISKYADDAYKATSKLGGIASKLPFKKLMAVLGPVGAAAGFASDALASDDLGAGEDAELEKMKQEAIDKKDHKLMELKAKMAEMAAKPLSPQGMLQNTATPMIKELGGPADVNPKLSLKLLGEEDSPDYESGLSPEQEIKRMKKERGYSR